MKTSLPIYFSWLMAITLSCGSLQSAEPPDLISVTTEQKKQLQDYVNTSKAALAKLLVMIGKGEGESGWQSTCRDPQSALDDLKRSNHITPGLQKWYDDEVTAWKRMASTGKELADANARILHYTDLIEMDTMRSKLEIVATSTKIKQTLQKLMRSTGETVGTLNDLGSRVTDFSQKTNIGPKDVPAAVTAVSSMNAQVATVLGNLRHFETAENLTLRLIDNYSRRKIRQATDEERNVSQLNSALTRLVSIKIDPDGRGAFYSAEQAIEKVAMRNLDNYRDRLKAWREVNEPAIKNAKALFTDLVGPVFNDLTPLIPGNIGSVDVGKVALHGDEFISDMALKIREAVTKQVGRWTGSLYARLAELIVDTADKIEELEKITYPKQLEELENEFISRRESLYMTRDAAIAKLKKEWSDQRKSQEGASDGAVSVERAIEIERSTAAREVENLRRNWYEREVKSAEQQHETKVSALRKELERVQGAQKKAQ